MKVIDIIKPSLNEGALSQVGRQEIIDIAGRAISDAIKFGKRVPSIDDILRRKNIPGGTLTPKEIAELEAAAQKRAAEIAKEEKAAFDKKNSVVTKTKAEWDKIKTGSDTATP